MKYLKKFNENKEDDSEVDYISDLFIEYADKYNLTEGESIIDRDIDMDRSSYYVYRSTDYYTREPCIIVSIIYFGENPWQGMIISESDIQKFRKRLESLGYKTKFKEDDFYYLEHIITITK